MGIRVLQRRMGSFSLLRGGSSGKERRYLKFKVRFMEGLMIELNFSLEAQLSEVSNGERQNMETEKARFV